MSTAEHPRVTTLPPLEAGQRMRREEFHARYEAMPPGFRAELIGGVVYVPSPVGWPHGSTSANAAFWMGHYKLRTPGVQVLDNATAALDDLGEPQPDVALRILPECGGQTWNEGIIVFGAPELVVEVAGSSRAIDLGVKKADYERAGVLEYVVVALDPAEVFWHVRREDRLGRVAPDADGLYRSATFPGLWLDPIALLADDGPALIAALERGMAAPEHAAFVARLAAARGTA